MIGSSFFFAYSLLLCKDGDRDGDIVGDIDWDIDGDIDCDIDCDIDGDRDGDIDCDIDGDRDCDIDGDRDGDIDGDIDGEGLFVKAKGEGDIMSISVILLWGESNVKFFLKSVIFSEFSFVKLERNLPFSFLLFLEIFKFWYFKLFSGNSKHT